MKLSRIRKKLLVITFLLLVSSGLLINEWYGKPLFINNLFNRLVVKLALTSPEALTSIHWLENYGISGHNQRLDDASPAMLLQQLNMIKNEVSYLNEYQDSELTANQKISKQIVQYFAELLNQATPYVYHNYPVNQVFGVQSNFISFMQTQHQINSRQDGKDYIARLQRLPIKFSQLIEGLEFRARKNIVAPRFILQKVIQEINSFLMLEPKNNLLYLNLQHKLERLSGVSTQQKTELLKAAEIALAEQVLPAYKQLRDYLVRLAKESPNQGGMWRLPDGDEAYQVALKLFTSTSYTPDYIHNVGLSEVARLQQSIVTILTKAHQTTYPSYKQMMHQLAQQESQFYPDNEAGREQIISRYGEIISQAQQQIDSVFNFPINTNIKVQRVPLFKQLTSPMAYYIPSAVDGSRAAVFYVNLANIQATPKYTMKTLAYHEAIPGHHLQISVAQQLTDLPLFRRFAPFPAYIEGWALYAENLAFEQGLIDDPLDNVGRLQAELFRAVRLVVDTGIHAKQWSRQQAVNYMLENTNLMPAEIEIEVDRYFVLPGQACAYKVGMMKILELRSRAQESLGKMFDLAEFHDVILNNGAVPLDILEMLVTDYINQKLHNQSL
ncbi:DUF885 domain-containing protein [Aliikangiella sp. IMCC44632]